MVLRHLVHLPGGDNEFVSDDEVFVPLDQVKSGGFLRMSKKKIFLRHLFNFQFQFIGLASGRAQCKVRPSGFTLTEILSSTPCKSKNKKKILLLSVCGDHSRYKKLMLRDAFH